MTDYVGKQLGNYHLTHHLGQGGFAEVYLGEHIYLGTLAAVKVLHTQLAGEDVNAFRNEARTVARLEHPHIVRVLDFGLEGTVPFLVMGYAPNGSLRQRHPRGTRLPLTTIVSYVKQVADALQYAHDEKLMHRDIKPENMLLDRRNAVLLSDFGIALVAQSTKMQSVQEVIGTVAYMAPEMLQGRPRLASDQYALGVVVYEWLCGERPFHGGFTELASQHMFVPPPSLREKLPAIAPEIEQVVMTTLAKDPHQRFGSVSAFATALEQACQATQSQPSVIIPQPDQFHVPTERAKPLPPSAQVATPPHAEPPPTQVATPPHPELPPAQVALPSQPEPLPTQLATPYSKHSQPTEVQTDAKETPALTTLAQSRDPVGQEPHGVSSREKPQAPGQKISRRAILIGMGGLAVVGGGITWFIVSKGQSTPAYNNQVNNTPTATSTPTATPTPTVGSILYEYNGHTNGVLAVAWSPDGKRIASGSFDKTVQVWDAAGGGHAYTYRGHTNWVEAVAWSPDSKRIASGSDDKTVQVWDAAGGGHVYTYRGHISIASAVAWSPDGKRIASASDDETVQVWDATGGSHAYTYRGHISTANAVAWSPDGRRIASGSQDKTVQVWDAADGGNAFTYRGHSAFVHAVVWSPDGKRIASGSQDNTVQVWDAAGGGHVYTYRGHSNSSNAVAWSSDGKRIASASDDYTVQVWDATNGGNAFTYRGHSSQVFAVAWSPDGKRIASGSFDQTVQVWQAG